MGSKITTVLSLVPLLGSGSFKESINNVKTKLKDSMFTAWTFGPFAHCITCTGKCFLFMQQSQMCFYAKLLICIPKAIPAQHRLLWIEFVDIFWNAIHSALDRDGTIGLEEEGDDAATIVAVEGHDNEVEEKMLEMLDFLQALFLRLQITLYLHWNERSWYGFCS